MLPPMLPPMPPSMPLPMPPDWQPPKRRPTPGPPRRRQPKPRSMPLRMLLCLPLRMPQCWTRLMRLRRLPRTPPRSRPPMRRRSARCRPRSRQPAPLRSLQPARPLCSVWGSMIRRRLPAQTPISCRSIQEYVRTSWSLLRISRDCIMGSRFPSTTCAASSSRHASADLCYADAPDRSCVKASGDRSCGPV